MPAVLDNKAADRIELDELDLSVFGPPYPPAVTPRPGESLEDAAKRVITGDEHSPSLGGRMVFLAAKLSALLDELPAALNRPGSPNTGARQFDDVYCELGDTEWIDWLEFYTRQWKDLKIQLDHEFAPLYQLAVRRESAAPAGSELRGELQDLKDALHLIPQLFGLFS